jgi:two-component system chemotaxis sensor kinase CheA
MSFDMEQFTQVFFEEAKEHLATIEEVLLRLDLNEPSLEDLNAIFRAAHSIKGGAGTFGFGDTADFTHVMETLLDRLRKQELTLTSGMVDALLQANDVIASLLSARQTGESADPDKEAAVRASLEAFSAGTTASAAQSDIGELAPPPGTRRYRLKFPVIEPAADMINVISELRALGTLKTVSRPELGRGKSAGKIKAGSRFEFLLDTLADRSELRDLFGYVLSPDALELEELGEPEEPLVPYSEDLLGFGFFAGAEGAPEETAGFGFFDGAEGAPKADDGFGFFDDAAGAPPAMTAGKDEGFGFFADAAGAPGEQPAEAKKDDGFGFFGDAPGAPGSASATPATAPSSAGRRATEQPDADAAKGGRRATDKSAAPAANADSSIRVSVEKVDQLINLVGELVITQSMLAQAVSRVEGVNETLSNGIAQLERNSRDLQEAVMSIRMLPIAFVFSRFPRLVRDIASKLGKAVDLKLVGEQTELDKGVIEKIADPLTHLVRNSLDHGLESTEDRVAAGKPANGTITLRAFHQGGNIVIEVSDDGKGLDRNKILAKARSRGMPVDDSMSDSEVFGLIFEAGFSTAEQVTDISGRGVGMDVVRKNIAALGGRVEIQSVFGRGCTVSIRLPLTLAILDGISVAVGDSLYIVPLGYIMESLQPAAADIRTISGTGLVMQVRGEYLPVVQLHETMGVEPKVREFHRGIMVILEADGERTAMFVDELVGQHQVVIKSLESNYRKVPGISAATIMGDGKVAMILDAVHLVRSSTRKRDYLQAA